MQRWAPLVMVVLTAWLGTAQAQSEYIIQQNAAPLQPLGTRAAPAPRSAPVPTPGPAAQLPAMPAAPATTARPGARPLRIGLLLPTDSKRLGEAAAVVRSGFEAAAAVEQNAEVVRLDADEDSVAARYREAVTGRMDVVVGPLTREGIAAVAPQATVPTLALNTLDPAIVPNPKLFSLSLNVEGEARQLARLMRDDGRARPLVVVDETGLARRIQQAFSAEWGGASGRAVTVVDVTRQGEEAVLAAAGTADAVLLAVDSDKAPGVRRLLPAELAAYGTSQLHTLRPDPALNGVRIIDMPWFVMADHPAVKRYPRPTSALTMPSERLYALGIDAYRLAVQLGQTRGASANLRLNGVTGDLRLARDRQFERTQPLVVIGSETP
ncbi:LppC putative lipoprotein [Gulbenkiania indica]|uniref:LppC putative lipoprotein n=1 Tax=Gulbenkiania indica TaxID=375574 RepID=A0A0K6GT87_9NEIS|nr:penicillin-binding protein activator [Gulbenkiania indica]CUA81935.1 LppC putative lipoprotein [Gulbenkiania indica]